MQASPSPHPRDVCTFAAQALASRLRRLFSYVEGVRIGKDPEAVHQMRVWSRRARVVYEQFPNCFHQEKEYLELGKELRALTRALRAARDLDVMLSRLNKDSLKLPENQRGGVLSLCERLQQRRQKKQQALVEAMNRLQHRQVQERLAKLLLPYGVHLKTLGRGQAQPKNAPALAEPQTPHKANSTVPSVAAHALTLQAKEVARCASRGYHAEAVQELHDLRIAIKHLRYTLELFIEAPEIEAALLPEEKLVWNALLIDLRSLQEMLGDIHDADVLMPILLKHMARLLRPGYVKDRRGMQPLGVHRVDLPGLSGLLSLCQQLQEHRNNRHLAFVTLWQSPERQSRFQQMLLSLERLKETCSNLKSHEEGPIASSEPANSP